MLETIRVERELLNIFREYARTELGSDATDARVEARATELYEGPPPRPESAKARRIREANTRLAIENYNKWLA